MPLKCEACGQARIGLFKVQSAGGAAPPASTPANPSAPAAGTPQIRPPGPPQIGGAPPPPGGVAPTPTPAAPTPVTPSPVAPTPVTPTPVAPTPVQPVAPVTPVAPTPVEPTPTPVQPTPVTPSPVAPTPVAPTPVTPTPAPTQEPTPVAPSPVDPIPAQPTPVEASSAPTPSDAGTLPPPGPVVPNDIAPQTPEPVEVTPTETPAEETPASIAPAPVEAAAIEPEVPPEPIRSEVPPSPVQPEIEAVQQEESPGDEIPPESLVAKPSPRSSPPEESTPQPAKPFDPGDMLPPTTGGGAAASSSAKPKKKPEPTQKQPVEKRPHRESSPEPPAPPKREPPQEAPAVKDTPAPVVETPKPTTPAAPSKAKDGSLLWNFPKVLPGQGSPRPALRNAVACGNDGRFYAALADELLCMSDGDGAPAIHWKYQLGGFTPGSPTVGSDDRIRVHAGDGVLHCVNDAGEQEFAPVALEEPLGWASPVVDENGNTFICNYSGGLVKVDPSGGKNTRPHFRSRQKFDSTGLIRHNVFYVGAEDGFVYAIDLEKKRPKNIWDPLEDKGKTEWFINSSPAVGPRGEIIVAGRDEYLYSFKSDGSLNWKLHLRGQMLASPIVDANGDIYVGISLLVRGEEPTGKLVCVSGDSHKVRWEFRAEGPIESTPVLGNDGVIYIGDNAGHIHALNEKGGIKWSTRVGQPVRSAGNIVAANRLIFGLDDGTLACLTCSSESLAEGWPKYMGKA